jgi:anti-sigma B factor antagonist
MSWNDRSVSVEVIKGEFITISFQQLWLTTSSPCAQRETERLTESREGLRRPKKVSHSNVLEFTERDCCPEDASPVGGIMGKASQIAQEITVIDFKRGLSQPRSTVNIERTQVGDKIVLHVAGRMDADNAVQFEQQCESCISEGVTSLIIDLGDLKYISSMGLRSFVLFSQKLREKGGELRICRMNGLVQQVFEITRLNQVLVLHDSVESALMEG